MNIVIYTHFFHHKMVLVWNSAERDVHLPLTQLAVLKRAELEVFLFLEYFVKLIHHILIISSCVPAYLQRSTQQHVTNITLHFCYVFIFSGKTLLFVVPSSVLVFVLLFHLFLCLCVCSLRAQLCTPPAASPWSGLGQQSSLWRPGVLLLSDGLQAAGLRCTDMLQR